MNPCRCAACGRFLGHHELDGGEISFNFIPEYNDGFQDHAEEWHYTHKRCLQQTEQKKI